MRQPYPNELSHAWLKKGAMAPRHKYIKREGTSGHYKYTYPSENMTMEDIMNLSWDEMVALDADEYDRLYNSMTPDERKAYRASLTEKIRKYVSDRVGIEENNTSFTEAEAPRRAGESSTKRKTHETEADSKVRSDVRTGHKDNRYNLFDKAREQITGELDADRVERTKNAAVNYSTSIGEVETIFGSTMKAVSATNFARELFAKSINYAYDNTANAKVKKFLNRLGFNV